MDSAITRCGENLAAHDQRDLLSLRTHHGRGPEYLVRVGVYCLNGAACSNVQNAISCTHPASRGIRGSSRIAEEDGTTVRVDCVKRAAADVKKFLAASTFSS